MCFMACLWLCWTSFCWTFAGSANLGIVLSIFPLQWPGEGAIWERQVIFFVNWHDFSPKCYWLTVMHLTSIYYLVGCGWLWFMALFCNIDSWSGIWYCFMQDQPKTPQYVCAKHCISFLTMLWTSTHISRRGDRAEEEAWRTEGAVAHHFPLCHTTSSGGKCAQV